MTRTLGIYVTDAQPLLQSDVQMINKMKRECKGVMVFLTNSDIVPCFKAPYSYRERIDMLWTLGDERDFDIGFTIHPIHFTTDVTTKAESIIGTQVSTYDIDPDEIYLYQWDTDCQILQTQLPYRVQTVVKPDEDGVAEGIDDNIPEKHQRIFENQKMMCSYFMFEHANDTASPLVQPIVIQEMDDKLHVLLWDEPHFNTAPGIPAYNVSADCANLKAMVANALYEDSGISLPEKVSHTHVFQSEYRQWLFNNNDVVISQVYLLKDSNLQYPSNLEFRWVPIDDVVDCRVKTGGLIYRHLRDIMVSIGGKL